MIDIRRYDGPASCHFFADKFRCDVLRDAGAEGFARMLETKAGPVTCGRFKGFFSSEIFPDRDEFHFRRDDTPTCVRQLCHGRTIGDGRRGPMVERLQGRYRELVDADVAAR